MKTPEKKKKGKINNGSYLLNSGVCRICCNTVMRDMVVVGGGAGAALARRLIRCSEGDQRERLKLRLLNPSVCFNDRVSCSD